MRYSVGYGMFGERTVGWGGSGGSLVMIDPDTRVTIAYAMNQMLDEGSIGDDRALSIVLAAYDGL
jgi:CubicO group peptidase (beta-lactamase class C family)